MSGKYRVWTCKIVVNAEKLFPAGFDFPPRMAAEKAIEDAGFPVLLNASGWGGSLNKQELQAVQQAEKNGKDDVYFVGVMDTPEDTAH